MSDSAAANLEEREHNYAVMPGEARVNRWRSISLANREPTSIGRTVVFAALVALLLERATAVANDLQLWGDGIWFLIRIASTRTYYFWVANFWTDFYKSRVFTNLMVQTPLVLATHLRVHHLHALSVVFGITLYAHGLIALYLCYLYAAPRWYVLFPLLSLFAGTMNVETYIVTDSHVLVSLFWPILFILLFREQLTRGTLLLLLLLSIPTVVSYESMMFFGVVLAAVCLWRMRKFPRNRGLMAALAAWYLIGSGMAVAAVIWPFDPSNKAGFLRGLEVLYQSNHLGAKTSIGVLFCLALLFAVPSRLRIVQTLVAALGMFAVFYLCLEVFLGHVPTSLNDQISARVLNLIVPLIVTALLLLVRFGWFKPNRRALGLAAIVIGSLGIGQSFWTLACIGRWQGMLATLRYELALHEGPIAFEDSIMSHGRLGPLQVVDLHATWPLPLLSVYESEAGVVKSIVVPQANAYLPFDPLSPATFPNLSRYGITYAPYVEALNRNWRYSLGETLKFAHGGNAAPFLRGGWSHQESWATWSTQPDFELILPIADPVTSDVVLSAKMAPNLSAGYSRLTVDVFVNDVPVGAWSFQYHPEFAPETKQLPIPKDVLGRSSPVTVRFHIREPLKSPTELGKGADPRKLGVAFVNLRLDPVE